MSKIERKKAIIIGATSPIAQHFIALLAQQDYEFLLIARDENELKNIASDIKVKYNSYIEVLPLDINSLNLEKINELINSNLRTQLLAVFSGAMGNELTEDILPVTAINYIIPAQIMEVFASTMAARNQQANIVITSSVAGDRGKKSNYIYGAAKSALTEFSSGLRAKYASKNIHVLTVLPGFIDTQMTYGLIKPTSPLMAQPKDAAKDIFKALNKKRNIIYTPFFWRYIMLIIKSIPEFIFKKLGL